MKQRSLSHLLFFVVLSGCANDAGRWAGSNREEVPVEGATYRVVWIRTAEGIDAHSNNASWAIRTADMLIDKRQATEAMRVVAMRECASPATIMAETSVDQSFAATWKCSPILPATPARSGLPRAR